MFSFQTVLNALTVMAVALTLWGWRRDRALPEGAEPPEDDLASAGRTALILLVIIHALRVFNLEIVLVTLTALTGAIAGVYWLRYRSQQPDERPRPATLTEFSQSFFPVLLLVLVLRSFVFEPFKIPSGSMIPTLHEGDFIFVSKFSYGVRLPVIHTRLFGSGAPERGDVAVFRLPRDPNTNYIKRVVGLPGDQLRYRDGVLSINGERIRLDEEGLYEDLGKRYGTLYTEHLGDVAHPVIHRNRSATRDVVIRVPDGCYFMMGDNRDNSTDSRFPSVGCIDEKFLVGRAGRVWFNFHWDQERGPQVPRWERIGNKIE